MNAQSVIADTRLVHVRELKAANARLHEENARLRAENAELSAHLDLAILAAEDVRALEGNGRLLVVDGWNQILGASHAFRSRGELEAAARRHLEARPQDRVWIVFDGPRENAVAKGGLRISYTGGTGPHRADRFICDFLRMARFRGDVGRLAVLTEDADFRREAQRLGAGICEGFQEN